MYDTAFPVELCLYQLSTARTLGGPGWPSMTLVSITASRLRCSQFLGAFRSMASR
jgi:hypothetical protein